MFACLDRDNDLPLNARNLRELIQLHPGGPEYLSVLRMTETIENGSLNIH